MDSEINTSEKSVTRWLVLITVIIGTFLGRLDQTIVNLALPKIIADYTITVSAAAWIGTAYILANAVFVPIWGKLGDTVGRKKVYMLGFMIFIAGSVLAGFAWNLPSLIVFRVIQAIAGSADYPTAMAILAVTFNQGRERSQALGIWSASFAVAAVFGPLIGGPLIDSFSWRAVFLVNLPFGIIGLLMAWRFVEESVAPDKHQAFDWWGAIVLGISLSSVVLVLDKGVDWGWLSFKSIISYIIALTAGLLFICIEKRTREPIVDLKFFHNSVFVNALLNNFIVFMGMMGSVFLIPVFSQTFMGYNATESGYLFIPMAVALMIGAPLGGALTGKISARPVIIISTSIAAFGLYLFSFIDPRSTALDIMVPLSIMAFGMGFGMAHRTNIIASIVPDHEIGIASSILALARNIAGAFGIALSATILNNSIKNHILSIAQNSTLHSADPHTVQQFISLIILKANIDGYSTVFLVSSLVVACGAILAFWIIVPAERVHAPVHIE